MQVLNPPEAFKGKCFAMMVDHVKDYAIFLTDATGMIMTWNQAAAEMKGYQAHEVIGQNLSILYTDDEVRRGTPEHNLRSAAQVGTFQEEAWRKKKDGTIFWAMIELIALRDENGDLLGFCKITRDMTPMRELQQHLRAEKARANATLEAIHEGVISVKANGVVDYLNPKAEEFTGWTKPDSAGVRLEDIVHRLPPRDWRDHEVALLSAAGEDSTRNVLAKDGKRHIVETTTSVIFDEAGSPAGSVVVMRDMEPQLRAEMAVRDAETRKDEFLAMLAHELRNPLAPVSAAAELLSSGKVDDRIVKRSSQVISRQIKHMTSLVDDLLDVSRITRGLVSLEKSPLNIKTVVASALEQARPIMEAKRHALQVSLPPEAANVCGDSVRLVQVLVNLLNNAAKYTPPGGEICIRVMTTDQEIVCSVSDNGIGIDEAMQAHIFKLFEQAQRSSDRAQGGLGIGLALVKHLTELHGGSVSCRSEPGKGSVFTIRLPKLDEAVAMPERRHSPRGLMVANETLKILVVDDNADGAEMLGALLELEGHDVVATTDPHHALALTSEDIFDVCILDIGLPEMNGYELCQRILGSSAEDAKPVLIALTGYGQDRDREVAYEAGFSHYLVKPVDIRLLNSALETVSPQQGFIKRPGDRSRSIPGASH